MSAASAIGRRSLADARIRTIAFAYLFAALAYIQPVTYRHAYPTLASRLAFAHSFAVQRRQQIDIHRALAADRVRARSGRRPALGPLKTTRGQSHAPTLTA